MIHYRKKPSGDLEIAVPADEVGEVYEALSMAGLLTGRTFDNLKRYIASEFGEELSAYRRRMTAQIPVVNKGGGPC